GEAVIPLLVAALANDHPLQRERTVTALRSFGAKGVAPLLRALQSGHSSERVGAAEALGYIADEGATQPLLTALQDADAQVRGAAGEALSRYKPLKAVQPLIAMLNLDGERRDAAIETLSQMTSVARDDLFAALISESVKMRAGVVRAFRQSRDRSVIEILVGMLEDSSAEVRREAASALGISHFPEALLPLCKALHDDDVEVRRRAVWALANFPILTSVTSQLIEHLSDSDAEVRARVAELLGKARNLEAAQPLIGALRDPSPEVRAAATHSLSDNRNWDVDSVPVLIELVSDPDGQVRVAAVRALVLFRDTRALPALMTILRGPRDISKIVADGMSHWHDPEVTDMLVDSLREADKAFALRLVYALGSRRLSDTSISARVTAVLLDRDEAFWNEVVNRIRQILQGNKVSFNSPTAEPTDDNHAYFTAYYPREIEAETRYGLYIYSHHRGTEHAIFQDVQKFAPELGGKVPNPRTVVNTALNLVEGTPITITPECEGARFNPPSLTKYYDGKWTRYDFDFRTVGAEVGDLLTGRVSVQVGGVEVASIKLAMEVMPRTTESPAPIPVDNPLAVAKLSSETGSTYQHIFVSYSRQDKEVVENYRLAQLALGNDVFVDTYSIRTGENWQAALARAIDSADIFQLFWSESSAASANVKDEWD
ncbi:MAG: HEAT repeat domain-containing protein, partial [Anaerolineae bacterium]|nr:HEAT repeat domain-containing protein [Anaerolineae bacterium]